MNVVNLASFDVWDTNPHDGTPVWLGYVTREYVDDLGMMWCAYRADGFGHTSGGGNGVPMDAHDTPVDAQQEIRDFWEV